MNQTRGVSEKAMKVCLVTSELPGFGPSGGIGTAFQELSYCLVSNGISVDILYTGPTHYDLAENFALYSSYGVNVKFLDRVKYVWNCEAPLARSYAIYRTLLDCNIDYDFVHFAEYEGAGFYTIQAKRLLGRFADTKIVVQTHGSTRWALACNSSPLTHPDHILVDFMECRCLEGADLVVSPSQYLLDWFIENGLDAARKGLVIPNLASSLERRADAELNNGKISEIIMFGRHEFRKGITTFCDALDNLSEDLASRHIRVTFLGQPSTLNEVPSEIWLTDRARKWKFETRILSNFSRNKATAYISKAEAPLVVIPSSQENSPYTVLENLALGVPLITSKRGGAKELIPLECHEYMLFDGTATGLAGKIKAALEAGLKPSRPAIDNKKVEREWLELHKAPGLRHSQSKLDADPPRVVLGITHYERPEKLLQAVFSALDQTYPNVTVVVVDDGSRSEAAIAALKRVERLIKPSGGKVIVQQNKYLGAARNTIARETVSDYLVFLDDDDIALPHMVETLVLAATNKPDAIIAPLNFAMEERRRGEALVSPENFPQKMSYFISGGPISLMPFGNYLSTATALIPRQIFDALGGYSELKGVGFEDFELYIRALQQGYRVEALPEPLYLYEVDRPSMVSATPAMANLSRVLNVVDMAQNPTAWKDAIGSIAAREAQASVHGRATWLEERSPFREYFRAIRAHGQNSRERFQALGQYAEAIGAPSIAAAWRTANLAIDKVKPVALDWAMDTGISRSALPLRRQDKKRLVPVGVFPAVPYETAFFALSLGYESCEDTEVEWEVIGDAAVVVVLKRAGSARWINLELGLNRFDLHNQGAVRLEIDLKPSIPLSGSALLRTDHMGTVHESEEQRYHISAQDTLVFELPMPESWKSIPDAEPRLVMHLPLSELRLQINGVRCSARPRNLQEMSIF